MSNFKNIEEIRKLYKGDYEECEVYKSTVTEQFYKGIHTDSIEYIEELPKIYKILDYELMNEEDYNTTVLANSSETYDFEKLYGNKNAKVLVIVIEEV